MSKPMPVLPPLDLASLSIHDLWCLSNLFENLAHTAMNFLNQPRVSDADSVPSTASVGTMPQALVRRSR